MSKKEIIIVRDRQTKKLIEEEVYGGSSINFFYGKSFLGKFCRSVVSKYSFVSALAGCWFSSRLSRSLVLPFIQRFNINTDEFVEQPASFTSFNNFFIRKLKSSARPIAGDTDVAVMPADGRYLFFQNISRADGFYAKGKKFNLEALLGSKELASQYENGAMVIARLCPTDYHRFHFPVQCQASAPRLINGSLYSVNPKALIYNIHILTENKRYITELDNTPFGKILYLEIGATNVGSVVQTYTPNTQQAKGAEKGYFQFGASCVIMLFPPNAITFDQDLVSGNPQQEMLCLMGQSLGRISK